MSLNNKNKNKKQEHCKTDCCFIVCNTRGWNSWRTAIYVGDL